MLFSFILFPLPALPDARGHLSWDLRQPAVDENQPVSFQ